MTIEHSLNANMNEWENPNFLQRNRLPTRAYHIPQSHVLLNGQWKFKYNKTPVSAPDINKQLVVEAENWDNIHVPGHWQLQGYGNPHYTNVQYPFPVDPPHVPSENGTGTYLRTFSLDDSWDLQSKIRLRFDGVDSAYYVFVNGVEVGYSQGSRNCAEFDITDLVKRKDTNTIAVRVLQWCDGSYIEDQDQWWLSGIFRDVTLIAFSPSGHIEDFHIDTTFDSNYENATLSTDLYFKDIPEIYAAKYTVGIELSDPSGAAVLKKELIAHHHQLQERFPILKPSHWTAETPNLYSLEISLKKENRIIHEISVSVGFRQVKIENGIILVNGKSILLKGANRHEHHPKYGRAVPLAFAKRDLILMKQHNINAVRCSHYPNDPKFYQLCNELGLWVIDEADLECHGFYDALARPQDIPEEMDYDQRKKLVFGNAAKFTTDNPEWKEAYLDRAKQLVLRDRNFPCIFMWSLGNEAFYGRNIKAMYDYIRSIDASRPIHYEGDMEAVTADVYSYMYPSLERLHDHFNDKTKAIKPVILCEYLHAMGNGPGAAKEYLDCFRQYPRLQGGFVWEWANHGFLTQNDKGQSFYGYGGDFGDYPNDGNFVFDGLCDSEHNPTPGLTNLKAVYQPFKVELNAAKSTVVIQNLYDYNDLSHLDITWAVTRFPSNHTHSAETLSQGSIHSPKGFESAATFEFEYPWKRIDEKNQEVWVTFTFKLNHDCLWAKKGFIVGLSQLQLSENKTQIAVSPSNDTSKPEILETKESVKLKTIDSSLEISKETGKILNWSVAGQSKIIPGTNRLTFWRSPTDNDKPVDAPMWKRFGLDTMHHNIRGVEVESEKGSSIIVKSYISPPVLAWGFDVTTVYTVESKKLIIASEVTTRTHQTEDNIPRTLPRIGWEFAIPSEFTNAQWFGLGPGESYPDKKEGVHHGVFTNTTDKLDYTYEFPQENGSHENTRWLWVGDVNGKGITSRMYESNGYNKEFAFKVSDQYIPSNAKHPCDVEKTQQYVRLDYAQNGLGSQSCGPGPLPQHTLNVQSFDFTFVLEAD